METSVKIDDEFITVSINSNPDFWRGYDAGKADMYKEAMSWVLLLLSILNLLLW